MASRDWLVRYRDGREERVGIGRPAELVWFAETFQRDPADEGLLAYADACRLIHRALGEGAPPFETWIEDLEEIVSPRNLTASVFANALEEDEGEEEADPGEPSEEDARSPAATTSASESLVSR